MLEQSKQPRAARRTSPPLSRTVTLLRNLPQRIRRSRQRHQRAQKHKRTEGNAGATARLREQHQSQRQQTTGKERHQRRPAQIRPGQVPERAPQCRQVSSRGPAGRKTEYAEASGRTTAPDRHPSGAKYRRATGKAKTQATSYRWQYQRDQDAVGR